MGELLNVVNIECNPEAEEIKLNHVVDEIKHSDIGKDDHILPESSSKIDQSLVNDKERTKDVESLEKQKGNTNVEPENAGKLNSANAADSNVEVEKSKLNLDIECFLECNTEAEEIKLNDEVEEVTTCKGIQKQEIV